MHVCSCISVCRPTHACVARGMAFALYAWQWMHTFFSVYARPGLCVDICRCSACVMAVADEAAYSHDVGCMRFSMAALVRVCLFVCTRALHVCTWCVHCHCWLVLVTRKACAPMHVCALGSVASFVRACLVACLLPPWAWAYDDVDGCACAPHGVHMCVWVCLSTCGHWACACAACMRDWCVALDACICQHVRICVRVLTRTLYACVLAARVYSGLFMRVGALHQHTRLCVHACGARAIATELRV